MDGSKGTSAFEAVYAEGVFVAGARACRVSLSSFGRLTSCGLNVH